MSNLGYKKPVIAAMVEQLELLLKDRPNDELSGWDKANQIAHLVLEGSNFDDASIYYCIERIETTREQIMVEALQDHQLYITKTDIDIVLGFLRFLLTIPEDVRDEYEEVE